MTKLSAIDLSPFYRNSIGVDRLLDRLISQADHAAQQNYPPYNIVRTGTDTFEVQVAVAGFGQGEIDITVRDGNLVITGEKQPEVLSEGAEYLHQGISARRFIRTFSLADFVEVKSAACRDGILIVSLERIIPDAMKPKTIAIDYKS